MKRYKAIRSRLTRKWIVFDTVRNVILANAEALDYALYLATQKVRRELADLPRL